LALKSSKIIFNIGFYSQTLTCYTGCVSESGDFATLFFLIRQHWGGCRYRHFAATFEAF